MNSAISSFQPAFNGRSVETTNWRQPPPLTINKILSKKYNNITYYLATALCVVIILSFFFTLLFFFFFFIFIFIIIIILINFNNYTTTDYTTEKKCGWTETLRDHHLEHWWRLPYRRRKPWRRFSRKKGKRAAITSSRKQGKWTNSFASRSARLAVRD